MMKLAAAIKSRDAMPAVPIEADLFLESERGRYVLALHRGVQDGDIERALDRADALGLDSKEMSPQELEMTGFLELVSRHAMEMAIRNSRYRRNAEADNGSFVRDEELERRATVFGQILTTGLRTDGWLKYRRQSVKEAVLSADLNRFVCWRATKMLLGNLSKSQVRYFALDMQYDSRQ